MPCCVRFWCCRRIRLAEYCVFQTILRNEGEVLIEVDLAGWHVKPRADRPPAPEFSQQDKDGQTHQLASYRDKGLVVKFWATWCPPCREEMPSMQRAWAQLHPQGIELVPINVGEGEEEIFAFQAGADYGFPILLDRDSAVLGGWPVLALPTTLVVNPEGRILYRAIGGREWDDPELLETIRALR